MSFVHLHAHSHYSLLKAVPQIDALIARAKEQGMTAVALTDNGALYGAIEFYESCKKAGIKPIIGCELYMVPNRHEKSNDQPRPYHLTVLAEHYDGYRNLIKLVSDAALEGFHDGLPRADKELFAKYHEGLIVLSGCKQGEIAQLILSGEKEKAQRVAEEYGAMCGEGNFYLELQDHLDLDGQFLINEGLQEIARVTGLPMVVTRDVHYLDTEDAEACEISVCIGLGRTVHDHRGESLINIDRSMSTVEQIQSRWRHLPEALENTVKIADRINIEIKLDVWHFPLVEKSEDVTYDDVLREATYTGIAKLLPEITPEMTERLEYELGIIKTKGYAPYFLAVADYIAWARSVGIVTTTRGSAAGSLVSYSIGIVAVNPLFFKLPFERFLNPFRPSPPDVDGDFADDRREEVIEYVTQKYGRDRVAQIITFGTMAARASVRDAGRALGFSYGFCDRVAKLIPFGAQGTPMTIERALAEAPDLQKIYDEQPEVKRLIDIAKKIEGNARHTSIHAAGVVISPEPLTNFSPVQYEIGGTRLTTQYEMHAVEKAGVLKMDFLGIRNLSILGNAVKLIHELYGVEIDLQKIPWDDKKTYAMLTRGETVGVFQLSGAGMTRYLKELRPSNIFDIMAMVALFRPGPMDSIPEYIKRKHNPSLVTYLDERLKPILDQSFGILTYQDDVLLAAIAVAGYNWEEVDKFRKAMGKKIPEEMARQKEKFFTGAIERGMPELKVEILWQLIEPFAAYGFGRAHAASYAVVAYNTAYLKANYPAAYMTSVLSAESDDIEKLSEVTHECERMGIKVLPPNVNESFEKFSVTKEADGKENIRFGLSAVKNVGAHITEAIIAERKSGGPFMSLPQFLERVRDKDLNKKSIESLIKCGAMDMWGDRGMLLANVERMLIFAREHTQAANSNQGSLLGLMGAPLATLVLQEAPDAPMGEKLKWEKELIGLYISSHPCTDYARDFKGQYTEIASVENEPAGGAILLLAIITEAKKKWTKNHDAMMNAKIEDLSASTEVMVFPKSFAKTEPMWISGECIALLARRSSEAGDNKIFVENAEILTPETAPEIMKKMREQLIALRNKKRYVPRGDSNTSVASEAVSAPTPLTVIGNVTIELLPEITAEQKEQLKSVLASSRGDVRIIIRLIVNETVRLVETDYAVAWTPDFESRVRAILGADVVIIRE
ncbi:MAG: DNA polymerase III subunit alpha [Candidatus Magasanikbacteria bacterium]|nr:DNA polymerase III subunit alpha [Candidatus Magasanikbacteria bacterium]